MKTKSARGGSRKGAGRKRSLSPRKRINVYLSIAEIESLKRIDKSVSKAIRMLIVANPA